jgi:NADPH:quinone reductase-like Zn-dependent oxidoreductase
MKAIFVTTYGGPEALQYGERPMPVPTSRQVLIKVHAAGVNPRDWQLRDGRYAFRHLSRPLPTVLGSDVSGIVVERGAKVTKFDVGDEVFAMQTTLGKMGGYAEYVAIGAHVVARKPESVSHVQAAAMPVAAMTAWQALHRVARIAPGSKVVIVGASGGVGHYAVQFAAQAGAVVTAVCSTNNAELVRSLGAHDVVDYTQHDFTERLRDQDVVFDTVGRESLDSCTPVLADHGMFMTTDPTPKAAIASARTALRLGGGRRARLVLVIPKSRDLDAIAELAAAGKVRSVIEYAHPLQDAGAALDKSRSGRTRGKLVLEVVPQNAGWHL